MLPNLSRQPHCSHSMLQRQLFKEIVSGIDILHRMGKFHYGLIHGVMICGKIWIRRSECILIISWLFLEFKFKALSWTRVSKRIKLLPPPTWSTEKLHPRIEFKWLDRSVPFKIKVHSVSDCILTFGTSCPLEPMTNFEWAIDLERIILISVIFFVTTSQKRDFVNSYK